MAGEFFSRGAEFYPPTDMLRGTFDFHPDRQEIIKYFQKKNLRLEDLFHWPQEGKGGDLVDMAILRHMIAGNISIKPFNHNQLQDNGYDVLLGENFGNTISWHPDPKMNEYNHLRDKLYFSDASGHTLLYNPYDRENINAMWGDGITTAHTIAEYRAEVFGYVKDRRIGFLRRRRITEKDLVEMGHYLWKDWQGIDVDRDLVFFVWPNRMIHGHTMEAIGGRNVVTTTISGRSTVGRHFIEVCSDAYAGNFGFDGQWLLEIFNKDSRLILPLVVGTPVATIHFKESSGGEPTRNYSGTYAGQRFGVDKTMIPKPLTVIRTRN